MNGFAIFSLLGFHSSQKSKTASMSLLFAFMFFKTYFDLFPDGIYRNYNEGRTATIARLRKMVFLKRTYFLNTVKLSGKVEEETSFFKEIKCLGAVIVS